MKYFYQFLNSLNFKTKIDIFIFTSFAIISSLLEIVSISLIVPIMEIVTKGEISNFFSFLKVLENYSFWNFNLIQMLCISLFITILIKNILLVYINYWQTKFENKIDLDFSNDLFSNYLNKKYIFFTERNSSEIIRNLVTEINSLIKGLSSFFLIFVEIILLLILLSFLLLYNFTITLLVLIYLSSISFFIFFIFRKKITKWSKIRIKLSSDLYKSIVETINHIKEIFIFEKHEKFNNRFFVKKKENVEVNFKFSFLSTLSKPILETLIIISLLSSIFLFFDNENLLTNLLVYTVTLLRIYPSAIKLVTNSQVFLFRLSSFKVIEVEKKYNEKYNYEKQKDNISTKNIDKIKIENLNFNYEKKQILKNINFSFNKGKTYGIIGKSGSGKSTLIDILMSIKEPTSGKIFINENECDYKTNKWTKFVGYVPQNVYLSDDTIANNICFGVSEKSIDKNKLKKVLEQSNLVNFIESLPKKLDTIVGEKGLKISGGQIQRIGIARALYIDPTLLFFDEATSQLDNDTETSILKDILKLKENKIIFFVTHKAREIGYFDEILDLKDINF